MQSEASVSSPRDTEHYEEEFLCAWLQSNQAAQPPGKLALTDCLHVPPPAPCTQQALWLCPAVSPPLPAMLSPISSPARLAQPRLEVAGCRHGLPFHLESLTDLILQSIKWAKTTLILKFWRIKTLHLPTWTSLVLQLRYQNKSYPLADTSSNNALSSCNHALSTDHLAYTNWFSCYHLLMQSSFKLLNAFYSSVYCWSIVASYVLSRSRSSTKKSPVAFKSCSAVSIKYSRLLWCWKCKSQNKRKTTAYCSSRILSSYSLYIL